MSRILELLQEELRKCERTIDSLEQELDWEEDRRRELTISIWEQKEEEKQ